MILILLLILSVLLNIFLAASVMVRRRTALQGFVHSHREIFMASALHALDPHNENKKIDVQRDGGLTIDGDFMATRSVDTVLRNRLPLRSPEELERLTRNERWWT